MKRSIAKYTLLLLCFTQIAHASQLSPGCSASLMETSATNVANEPNGRDQCRAIPPVKPSEGLQNSYDVTVDCEGEISLYRVTVVPEGPLCWVSNVVDVSNPK